jgi:hypothetical protein
MKSAEGQQEGSWRSAWGQENNAAVVEVSWRPADQAERSPEGQEIIWRPGDQVEITRRSRDYLEVRCLKDQLEISGSSVGLIGVTRRRDRWVDYWNSLHFRWRSQIRDLMKLPEECLKICWRSPRIHLRPVGVRRSLGAKRKSAAGGQSDFR